MHVLESHAIACQALSGYKRGVRGPDGRVAFEGIIEMARRKKPTGVELNPTYFREWRKFRDLTLEQVGESLDVDPTSISRLERGETPYDQYSIQQLAAVYKCSIPDLLFVDPTRERAADKLLKKAAQLNDPEQIKAAIAVIEALLSKH